MAIQTRTFAAFDGGAVTWEYDFEDSTSPMRLTQIRCTNNCPGHPGSADPGPWPTKGTVTVLANGRTMSRTVAPGGTLNQAIPTGAAVRLAITVDARGRVEGIEHSIEHGPGLV